MFKKLLVTILLIGLMIQPAWSVTQWTTAIPTSTSDNATNWPSEVLAQWTILQTLLSNYRRAMYLTYDSSSAMYVGVGEVMVSNGSSYLMLQNNSQSTVTSANLDTGSIAASTIYYVYCGTSSTTAAACTYYLSLSNTAPSGVTYYASLGTMTTDSSSNFSQIVDYAVPAHLGAPTTPYSTGSTYQLPTDGVLSWTGSCTNTQSCTIYNDSNPSPSTVVGGCSTSSSTTQLVIYGQSWFRKGDYFKSTGAGCGFTNWRVFGQ